MLGWEVRLSWLRGQDLNLRPSGYEPDKLPGCSTPRPGPLELITWGGIEIVLRESWSLVRFGGDLLSHVLRRSTIGVTALNGRVRDGIGCLAVAMTTKPDQRPSCALFGVQRTSVLFQVQVLGSCCLPVGKDCALLFPDQIKPIEQLVPVS